MGLKTSLEKQKELEKKQEEFLKKSPGITKEAKEEVEWTKQTIKLDRSTYKKIRNYCFDRKISFQDFITELIEKWSIKENER